MLLNCDIGEDSWEFQIQSILKEFIPGISLEGMMLKLKLQYFGHLMQRVDSLEKTDAGRDWGQGKGMTEDEVAGWHHRLDGCEWVNSGSWWWTGKPGVLWFMELQRVGHDWVTELTEKPPKKQSSGLDIFTDEIPQLLIEELTHILLKLFWRKCR